MKSRASIYSAGVVTAVMLVHSAAALAQDTPGDRTGTSQSAGGSQSAATSTNAPADPVRVSPTLAPSPASRTADAGAGDIIVTARRVEERLQDVPISITVFNQQQLSNRNIVQAQDLATYTPSLSANNNFGSQNTAFAIRGFVQDIGTQPSVGVYFADVVAPRGASTNIPIGDNAAPGSFFDLQNVQVLKGPQGTLFGRNTTGGAILIVPQKPTSRLEGYVDGSYGNYGLKRIQAVFNTPLGDDARFRIGVDRETRDGYLHNISGVGPNRFSDIDYIAARASLVVDLTPDLENYTIASFVRSDTHGDVQKVVACDPASDLTNLLGQAACGQLARERTAGAGFYDVENNVPDPRTLLTQYQIINTTTWRASDSLTIKNIASYAELKESFKSSLFGTSFDLSDTALSGAFGGLFAPGTTIAFTNITPVSGQDTANQSTFTEELQLQGKLGDRFTYQTGAYYELSRPLGPGGSQSPYLLNCVDSATLNCTNPLFGQGYVIYSSSKTTFRNVGLYAQGTYSLSDRLKLTGGVRYTWDRTRNSNELRIYNLIPAQSFICEPIQPALPADSCQASYHESSHKPTWLIDLDYKPVDDILLYAKYARGYRAGGITSNLDAPYAIFKPEKVDSYEAGLKTSFRGPVRGTFNISAFYNDFSNQQLQAQFFAGSFGATGVLNAGKSRIYGLEVESSVSPFTGFTLDASYTYLNAKLKKLAPTPDCPQCYYASAFSVEAGDPITLSPKNKVSVTGTYALPLDESVGRLSVGATFTHTDRQLANYTDLHTTVGDSAFAGYAYLNPRSLLNLNLNWNAIAQSHVDLSLFATNVTDKKYYAFVPGLASGTQFETATLGEPQMYGARLRYRFGG